MVNVTLDQERHITAVFAGDYIQAHYSGCAWVARQATQSVDAPFDIVITSNNGYPLDQNLYQSVKGMTAAAQIVRPGGAIVAVAECRDGLPEHGNYKTLLRMRESSASTSALSERTSGICALTTSSIRPRGESSLNGMRPVRHSNNTTPKEKISER